MSLAKPFLVIVFFRNEGASIFCDGDIFGLDAFSVSALILEKTLCCACCEQQLEC